MKQHLSFCIFREINAIFCLLQVFLSLLLLISPFFVLQCVQYVDGTVLPDLVPRLADLLRSGVGLRTKVR